MGGVAETADTTVLYQKKWRKVLGCSQRKKETQVQYGGTWVSFHDVILKLMTSCLSGPFFFWGRCAFRCWDHHPSHFVFVEGQLEGWSCLKLVFFKKIRIQPRLSWSRWKKVARFQEAFLPSLLTMEVYFRQKQVTSVSCFWKTLVVGKEKGWWIPGLLKVRLSGKLTKWNGNLICHQPVRSVRVTYIIYI